MRIPLNRYLAALIVAVCLTISYAVYQLVELDRYPDETEVVRARCDVVTSSSLLMLAAGTALLGWLAFDAWPVLRLTLQNWNTDTRASTGDVAKVTAGFLKSLQTSLPGLVGSGGVVGQMRRQMLHMARAGLAYKDTR